jgi:hypothetical protein
MSVDLESKTPAPFCTCCNDLSQIAAEFAEASRADNAEESARHREKGLEIITRHITDHLTSGA